MTCDHQECQDFDPTRETCLVETQLGRLERITKQLREDVEAFSGGSVSWSVDDNGVAHRTIPDTSFWDRYRATVEGRLLRKLLNQDDTADWYLYFSPNHLTIDTTYYKDDFEPGDFAYLLSLIEPTGAPASRVPDADSVMAAWFASSGLRAGGPTVPQPDAWDAILDDNQGRGGGPR